MAFYVYIMTNRPHGVLYTGVTDDIAKRAWMHREHVLGGFTDRYNCEMLVWYEGHGSRESAFVRERRIKEWKRAWKIELIEDMNPGWRDLASEPM
ncbi:GIY-YIG nuclease family protein [Kaustia mangrovi]|uniref:GIY-YIG nuclease family protein n=1 Tax=Kaustia mangrovi TaxID=2593653 RepID=A0A7S8HDK1_9HYPH|nr:GIY-YIG nuclease family protein [Kaustia mangrovi]QPC44892.1 GIY-YIG nuclease family protein [Kaustia mangrovi]